MKIQNLSQAFNLRHKLTASTNAVRLFNGQGDGIKGLIIDRYADVAIIYIYDEKLLHQLPTIVSSLEKHHSFQTIVLKERWQTSSSKPDDIRISLLKGAQTIWQVNEHGVTFEVDVNDGLNSGLFLDMRANRQLVALTIKDKRLLNCFAYTCAFGLHAKVNGAKEVVNVDLSQAYLNRGKRNNELNSLAIDRGEFLRFDAVDFLVKAVKKENLFDTIVIDPPSFARDRGRTFQIKRDLPKLMALGIAALAPKGSLLISTNCSDITHADLERILKSALNGKKVLRVTRLTQDTDFVGTNTFKESYLVGLWINLI